MNRTLDWRPNHDPKSREFRLGAAPSTRTSRNWRLRNGILDQQAEGACVGHGVINACSQAKLGLWLPNPQQTAFGMYFGSKRIDEWEGEDYGGTSVNAGCKLARELGFIGGWRWGFGLEDLKNGLLEDGPAVIGVWWYSSMYTAPGGRVVVAGDVVGGHCLCVTGYSRKTGDFQWTNSWGPDYGLGGRALVDEQTMGRLIENQGEVAFLVK